MRGKRRIIAKVGNEKIAEAHNRKSICRHIHVHVLECLHETREHPDKHYYHNYDCHYDEDYRVHHGLLYKSFELIFLFKVHRHSRQRLFKRT